VQVYGVADEPLYKPELVTGRWFTPAEARSQLPVAIIGRALADRAHAVPGQRMRIRTASGPADVRVIGTSTNVLFQGSVVFLPLVSMQRILGTSDAVNNYWVATDGSEAADDAVANGIEDAMGKTGTQVTTIEKYVQERENAASNAGMTNAITVLGLLIVGISLVGLVNAITMGVIERTREIGMLRCIGARARDVRRIFRAEGLLVTGAGWLLGVPLGWLMAHGLGAMTASIADTDIEFVFPISCVALTFVGTMSLAMVVLVLPVRRAVRLRPGDALRRL
jgi:putative ABC transport system permease protein